MVVAASPRIYMGRCPKVVFKPLVTSHLYLLSNLALGACRPLIACERGSAGAKGSEGSTGVVRRIKIRSAAEV